MRAQLKGDTPHLRRHVLEHSLAQTVEARSQMRQRAPCHVGGTLFPILAAYEKIALYKEQARRQAAK